jgi:LmbE family N-acetylglucosaminyl deacetylase
VVVVSPHLDDAVLSLGATIADHVAAGGEVLVLTVLAGPPGSDQPAGDWDRACGFATEADAVRARRQEDLRACRLLGAAVEHLDGPDGQYGRSPDEATLTEGVRRAVRHADDVLVPGYPLAHPDHRWVATTVLRALAAADRQVRLYAELPYALRPGSEGTPVRTVPAGWDNRRFPSRGRVRKLLAVRHYRSQLAMLCPPSGVRTRQLRALWMLLTTWTHSRRGEWTSPPLPAGSALRPEALGSGQ